VIAIVDFRAGNLTSVKKAFDHLGAETVVTSDPAQVAQADKIVLPGVGHFGATKALDDSGLREVILESIERGVPCGSEVAARRMEQLTDSKRLTSVARGAVGIVRLFHAFVSRPAAYSNISRV
jgi:imidazoleglycerol phosphate synthase glutamine amidotransferase subunit HisH